MIDLKATSLKLEAGEKFQVIADQNVIEFRRSADKVYVEEREFGFFRNWHKVGGEVRIILPKDGEELDRVTIDAGAGAILIEALATKNLALDLGAGRAEINNLTVSNNTKINGGAGLVIINDASLNDVDLDMGVGRMAFSGEIKGNADVDAGVGKLELTLFGDENDYRMKFSKGIGAISLNGQNMSDDSVWGRGDSTIDIDGGVGAIEVKVESKQRTENKSEEKSGTEQKTPTESEVVPMLPASEA